MPLGSVVEVTVRLDVTLGAVTAMLKSPVAIAPVLSCTCAVKGKVPDATGRPEMIPVLTSSVRPVGNAPPATLQR